MGGADPQGGEKKRDKKEAPTFQSIQRPGDRVQRRRDALRPPLTRRRPATDAVCPHGGGRGVRPPPGSLGGDADLDARIAQALAQAAGDEAEGALVQLCHAEAWRPEEVDGTEYVHMHTHTPMCKLMSMKLHV